jgi:hypothetical protein
LLTAKSSGVVADQDQLVSGGEVHHVAPDERVAKTPTFSLPRPPLGDRVIDQVRQRDVRQGRDVDFGVGELEA